MPIFFRLHARAMFGNLAPLQRHRVLVTGVGMVTPLGSHTAATWAALCAGKSACCSLKDAPFFVPDAVASAGSGAADAYLERLLKRLPCNVAAPVLSATSSLFGTSFAPSGHLSRSCQFSTAAVREALADAGLLTGLSSSTHPAGTFTSSAALTHELSVADRDRVGANIGVGIPSLADVGDVSHYLFSDVTGKQLQYSKVHPFFVSKILGNTPTAVASIEYGITGRTSSSVAACATGAYCISEAAEWVRSGKVDVVVCGSTEACITPAAIAGFCRMRALCSSYNHDPGASSRPFDTKRGGFVMGEGAGIMVLESQQHAERRGAPHVYGELRGWGISSDAHHVAAPHPEGRGAERCVREALEEGGVPADAVRYVNAHATGTLLGDGIELQALHRSLRGSQEHAHTDVLVSSSKGAMGHLLGAAGSVEAILSVLALDQQVAPPNVNLTEACWSEGEQKSAHLRLVPKGAAQSMQSCEAVLSTSFGFGGMNSCLLFTKYA